MQVFIVRIQSSSLLLRARAFALNTNTTDLNPDFMFKLTDTFLVSIQSLEMNKLQKIYR